jgi:hypothetical protein
MFFLLGAILISGHWMEIRKGPFYSLQECETENVRILMTTTFNGMQAKADCVQGI